MHGYWYIAPHKMPEISVLRQIRWRLPRSASVWISVGYGCDTSVNVNSLRMKARHHKHRNKHKRRSCKRKVCGFRYEIRKYMVSCHDLLLAIHSIIIERIVYGALKRIYDDKITYIFSRLVWVDHANDR